MAAKPHASTPPTVKEQAHAMIDRFPDDVTWADAVQEFAVAAAIAQGVDAAERGEFASDDEVAGVFAKARDARAG
jgi:predicted transcriptional regulator